LKKLKTQTDFQEVPIQLTLTATAAYNGIEEALRLKITREIKNKAQVLTFNLMIGFHLIAEFKADIRAGIMKKKE
jgi:hypothetical protein